MKRRWDVGCCGWKDQLMPGAMVFWRRIRFTEWITAFIHTYILKKFSGVVAAAATTAAVAVLYKLASKKK